MSDTSSLDYRFSTTRLLTGEDPVATTLYLPKDEKRQGEGGLRHKGYFKKSYDTKPLVTVITVVFNNERYIEQTIKSVIEQTYDNIEYIIIDGGSTDETLDIIKKYEEQIDYWVSEPDKGLYDAMNKAIQVSNGIWLNFLNSGDLYSTQDVLKHTMKYANINVDVIYSDLYLYSETNTQIKKITCNVKQLFVVHQSMVYKKSLHAIHGFYLVKKGLTISDYIFFNLLNKDTFIKSPYPISKNLEGGISSNLGHIREKFAVDYLFNNIGLIRMVFNVLYASFKRILFNK